MYAVNFNVRKFCIPSTKCIYRLHEIQSLSSNYLVKSIKGLICNGACMCFIEARNLGFNATLMTFVIQGLNWIAFILLKKRYFILIISLLVNLVPENLHG
jgi:hypothetical protein